MKHCDKKAVTINPTNRCNLRCIYCMAASSQEQTKPLSIDIDFAKQGIKDAIEGYPTGTKAKILRFFSPGEPTQNMACIKECISYARRLNPNIKTELQTNGLFKSEEDRNYIADNFDITWFSLDGPSEINGKNRPDEYGADRTAEIEANLRYIQRNTFVGVRATIVHETVDHQEMLVEYYKSLGIDYLYVNPVIEPVKKDITKYDGAVTHVDLNRFVDGFLMGYHRAKKLGMHYGCSLTFNFDEPTNVACRSCLPMPQCNPDGSVGSCDMALYINAPNALQCFLYGRWDAQKRSIIYDISKIKYLRARNIENLPVCKHCEIKEYCAGGCAGRIAYETGDPYGIVPEYCDATKTLANYMRLNEQTVTYSHP